MTNKLYVGNLDFRTTSGDLSGLFATVGQVVSVRLIEDRDTGQSKGFAFVEMGSQEEALKAISLFTGHVLNDRAMAVGEARERDAAPRQRSAPRDDRSNNRAQFRQVKHKSRGGANKRRF